MIASVQWQWPEDAQWWKYISAVYSRSKIYFYFVKLGHHPPKYLEHCSSCQLQKKIWFSFHISHHLWVVWSADPAWDQFQSLSFHCPHTPDQGLFCHHLTCTQRRHISTHCMKNIQPGLSITILAEFCETAWKQKDEGDKLNMHPPPKKHNGLKPTNTLENTFSIKWDVLLTFILVWTWFKLQTHFY